MLKNCTPLWREAHFQVKMLKNWGVRSTFWSWDVEKLHAAVAFFKKKKKIYIYIYTLKNTDVFFSTNCTKPGMSTISRVPHGVLPHSARLVLFHDSACEMSLHHQRWASNVGIFANDHHHIPAARANAMLHHFNNIPTSLLLHEHTANLKLAYKKPTSPTS